MEKRCTRISTWGNWSRGSVIEIVKIHCINEWNVARIDGSITNGQMYCINELLYQRID